MYIPTMSTENPVEAKFKREVAVDIIQSGLGLSKVQNAVKIGLDHFDRLYPGVLETEPEHALRKTVRLINSLTDEVIVQAADNSST